MNILPFIISLLLIIAISSNTLLKKKISDDIVSKSISGYMRASRKSLNEYETYYFNALKERPSKNSKKESTKEETNQDEKRKIVTENAKINIYSLVFGKKEDNIELYNLVLSLLKTLYSGKNFYKTHLEKDILNNVLYALKNQIKKDKDLHLANLFLKDSSLQKTYYKILKGTKFYDFDKKIGTPSLLDFIKFENTKDKILIKDASYELLLAIFNKKIVEEINILQIENPPNNLTKEKVMNICQKHHFALNGKMLDLFDFSNFFNSKEKTIVGLDHKTNIKIKRKIFL